MKIGGIRKQGFFKQSLELSPLITIVTIVRNGEQFLEETIINVLSQEYNNIEYIIIDGSSTDRSIEIIKKYESKIDYWISEPDKGIYDAMNKGISFATGKYVNFMNAGDKFFDSKVCNVIVDNLIINDIDVIYGDFIAVNESNNLEVYINSKPLSKIIIGMVFCHQSVFIKTEILLKIPFDINYKMVADYKQILSIFHKGYIFKNLKIPISKIAINGVSYSNIKTTIETIRVINSFKVNSVSILFFLHVLLIGVFRIVIGKKLSYLLRKFKWGFINNSQKTIFTK